jgi:hypothetical protein
MFLTRWAFPFLPTPGEPQPLALVAPAPLLLARRIIIVLREDVVATVLQGVLSSGRTLALFDALAEE